MADYGAVAAAKIDIAPAIDGAVAAAKDGWKGRRVQSPLLLLLMMLFFDV